LGKIDLLVVWAEFGPDELGADHTAGSHRGSKVFSMLTPVIADAVHGGKFDMIAIYGRIRPQQGLIHFDAAADLSGAHGISRDGLIHIGQPCERGRSAARAA